jgi:hypothetical protein
MQYGYDNDAGSPGNPPTRTVLRSKNSIEPTLTVENDSPQPGVPAGNGLEVIGGDFGVIGIGGHNSDTAGVGVFGGAENLLGTGVQGRGRIGVEGTGTGGAGVSGTSDTNGIEGNSTGRNGVQGKSSSRFASGVYGENLSRAGFGIAGRSNTPGNSGLFGAALWADNTAGGFAGYFTGNVRVSGTLNKSAGGFEIDHPVDHSNRYLYHSFVESPDMMNVYNGNVATDADGNATVDLPDYFEALNRDFRYQLTVLDQFAQAIVAEEVKDNRFSIKTDKPNVRVSWQVTGIRQDAWANAHRIEVEVEKPESQRGKYLTPEEHGQPATAGIYYIEWQASEDTDTRSTE